MKTKTMEYIHVGPNRVYRIVVKFHDGFQLSNANEHPGQQLWVDDALMTPFHFQNLFISVAPEKIRALTKLARTRDAGYHPPNFLNYYFVDFPVKIMAQQALEQLLSHQAVEKACLEINPVYPPSVTAGTSPGFHQSHLDPAPIGINAKYAWQHKGGDGSGNVRFIDIEQGWIEGHESVPVQTLPDSGINHPLFRDHGTAVLGVIQMQHTGRNGCGITPKAKGYILSQWRPDGYINMADAILTSIRHLEYGDVLLIQAQAYDAATRKAMPLEIFDINYELIRIATALGITVIEPAGNGNDVDGHDLDLFSNAEGRFFLNRSGNDFRDSGAIVVAAAGSTAAHKKKGFSNYGSRVDCYAWGENVMTAGSFPASSGKATNVYTKNFSGTSGASAIIAGAVIALQSIAEANLHTRLSPSQVRSVLSDEAYGTPSANGRQTDKIGVMPDLEKLIKELVKTRPAKKANKTAKQKATSIQ